MKKFLIPLLLIFTTAILAGCGPKEGEIPEQNNNEAVMEEVQEGQNIEEPSENPENNENQENPENNENPENIEDTANQG